MERASAAGSVCRAKADSALVFDFAALLGELRTRHENDSRPIFTTAELMERTSKSLGAVRKLIVAAQKAGKCKPTTKAVVGIDARERKVPAYEFSS